jgi:hypothetical protein
LFSQDYASLDADEYLSDGIVGESTSVLLLAKDLNVSDTSLEETSCSSHDDESPNGSFTHSADDWKHTKIWSLAKGFLSERFEI